MGKTYLFNPDNDMALANGDANYLPPRSARRMAEDLAFLPAWLAEEGDAVMIPNSDGLFYWDRTSPNGLTLPGIEWITDIERLPKQEICPWGWNPSLVKKLILRGATGELVPDGKQMARLKELSGRQTGTRVLANLMNSLASTHPLVGESHACTTEEEIALLMEAYEQTMLKAPWSCSGKGLRQGKGRYAPPLSGWCVRTLAQQGAVIVEPLYNKVKDFAMEFHSSGDGSPLTFVGYSSFVTDTNGAYEGNLLMTDEAIEEELAAYIPRETLRDVRASLQSLIGERVADSYRGYVGVDMMVCLTEEEGHSAKYSLHPCVEINLRMNMGVVAHTLYERYVAHGCRGRFVVEYHPTTEALKKAHLERMEAHPLSLTADGRIEKGYQPLTPIGKETQYVAWMMVSPIPPSPTAG